MNPRNLSRRQLAAVLAAAVLIAAGGAAAYTTIFTAGSGTTYETDSGLEVATSVDHGLDDANPFNGSDEVYINNLSVTANGQAAVTIDQFEGETTALSGIDATETTVTVDPGDKPRADISGGVTDLFYSAASLEDDEIAFTYSASDPGTITMTDLAPDTDWAAATSDGELVDSGTTNSAGDASISVDSASGEDVILFTPHAPQASNIQPETDTTLSDNDVQLSVDVNDTDFPTAQGDSVDATFYVDGETVSSQTLTSNGTATTNITRLGQSEWYVELEDDYGKTVQTETRTFVTPSTLRVLDELHPQTLVDGNLSVTVRAYAGETAISRNVTNGTMSLAGLPLDEPIVITTEAETYVDRRIIVEDITEQQHIYMLNASADVVPITFQVSDKTGRYPPESSRLAIEKAVNVSDEDGLKWQTISGDYFSADLKFPTTLADGQRYRVVIKNAEGDQRVLGSYIPYEPTVTTLSIGEIVWDIPQSEGVYSTTRYDDQGNLEVLYNDTQGATTQLNVTAWNRSTGEQVYQGITSDVQQSVETIPTDGDVIVSVQAARDGEPDYSYRGPVGGTDIEQGLPFGKWLQLGAQVLLLGIAGLVVGHMPKKGGLIVVPIAFGVSWMGIWPIHPASLGIAGALALAAATNRGGP